MENCRLKALVTGGTGFIGSNLIIELINRGWDVYALIRKNSSLGINRLKNIKELKFIYTDEIGIFEQGSNISRVNLMKIPQFDVCFHLASYGVDYRQQNISELIDANIKFTIDLVKFCNENNTRKFINTGSCSEYGVNDGKFLDENHPLNPQSFYGITKVASESMINLFCKNIKMNVVTARPFGVFGENEGMHRLVPQIIDTFIRNESLSLTNGEQVRDYLYIKDMVAAFVALAESELPSCEAFNICSSNEIEIKKIVYDFCKVSGADVALYKFGEIPYRDNEVMHFVGDNSKIRKYTNWKPKYSLEDGLRNTYEWYKINMGGKNV